jgi:hypothetical protein
MPRCHPLRRARSLAAIAAVATTVMGVLAGAPAAGAAVPAEAVVQSRTASGAHPFALPGTQTQVRAGTSPDGQVHQDVAGARRASTATAASAHIYVTYHGFSPQAQAAFQAAVDVWQHTITSSVPIRVDATWEPLAQGVLGQAGPTNVYCDVPGGFEANTCYPVALANAMARTNLNVQDPREPEISASFNSNFADWYYGTDGRTPLSAWDLESVVLHELGHGLGFISSLTGVQYDSYGNPIDSGLGYWGAEGTSYYLIFDKFAQDGAGKSAISYPSGSFSLGTVLRSQNLYWGGAVGRSANGGARPKLFAPGTWLDGSSGSHLDEGTYAPGSSNALMTPILNNGESIHDPGPIVKGIFADLGWAPATVSVPTGPGDRFVPLNPARVVNTQVTAGNDVTVGLLGRGGLPKSNVDAIVANVQVDSPTRAGYLRVTPGGTTSQTAVQEFFARQPVSNMVTVRLGANGTIRLHVSAGSARVFVDLAGYYQPAAVAGGATYHPLNTARIYGAGAPGLSAAQGYRAIPVLGRGGIPKSGVSAIVANIEVNNPTAGGYVRLTPAGVSSATSSQEYLPRQTISAATTVKVGAGGAIWARLSRGSAHIYVDVLGWYGASGDTSGASFHPVNTDRSYGTGAPLLTAGYDRDIAVAGTASVPLSGAVAVVANVETARPYGTGYLRVTPGAMVSSTATQHYAGGHDVSNLAIVKLNQGMIKLHLSRGSAYVFVDVSGYFA